GLSFPNVSIGNPVMCYSEHRFRLKACRNDIVLAETMIKAQKSYDRDKMTAATIRSQINNLSKEQSLLILVARLRLSLAEKAHFKALLSRNPDWPGLLEQAVDFGVAGLFYKYLRENQLIRFVPEKVFKELGREYGRIALKNLRIRGQINQVLQLLNERQMDALVLKGGYLANHFYPDMALRPMSDIDLLCKKHDIAEVADILVQNGYKWEDAVFQSPAHELAFWERNQHLPPFKKAGHVPVEIHFQLFADHPAAKDLSDTWAFAASVSGPNGGRIYRLLPTYQLLFLTYHLYLHFRKSERRFPLYWFVDIHEWVCRFGEKIDWEWLFHASSRLLLHQEIGKIFRTLKNYWHTPFPETVWYLFLDASSYDMPADFFGRDKAITDAEIQKKTYIKSNIEKISRQYTKYGTAAAVYLFFRFLFPDRAWLIREYPMKRPLSRVGYCIVHHFSILKKLFLSLGYSRR
ncbi:MAG: nucleotidyltransferase family protein, partial [Desulfobacteraceae bacterium]|nr:nucleotidyltransferase family protein [Desulfobacteraceae bacterium]